MIGVDALKLKQANECIERVVKSGIVFTNMSTDKHTFRTYDAPG